MERSTRTKILNSCKLYGILDTGYTDLDAISQTASLLCESGLQILQLRAKQQSEEEILALAKLIKPICKKYECLFVINDFPSIAVAIEADALHIGQDDGTFLDIKGQLPSDMLLGRSTHSPEQAKQALLDGFDYIGFGPLFPTPTKKGRPGIGLESIRSVEQSVGSKIPVFCIGGIKRSNLPQVLEAGARRVVVVSDLLLANNIENHASALISALDKRAS